MQCLLSYAVAQMPSLLCVSIMGARPKAKYETVLASQFPDCTVVAVAHKTATLIGFDHIICMANGNVVESGTPAQLLQARGEPGARSTGQKCV